MPHTSSSMRRSAALISLMALASRLLGLLRDMAMAWLLGGGPAAEALVIAMRVPHMIRRLFGEGSLSMTITAALVRLGCAPSPSGSASPAPDARRMAAMTSALHWRLALALGLPVALCCWQAEACVALLAPAASAAVLDQAAPLLRICLPYALAASLAALGMALLHSLQRFFLPALAPVLFNCAVLAAAALAACGGGDAAGLLAGGMLCGGIAQWASQRMGTIRLRRAAASAPADGSTAWRLLGDLPAGALGAAAPQLSMLCATAAASALPGGTVAALYYAERLLELPLGVLSMGLGIASLPVLSRLAAAGRHELLAGQTSDALRWSLLLTLPAAAGLAAVAAPLISLLLEHGAFAARDVRLATLALMGYLPALPACGLTRILLAACHARGMGRPPLYGALLATAASALAAGLCAATVHTEDALWTLTLSCAAALWIQPLLLWRVLNRSLAAHHACLRLSRKALGQMAFAALCTWLAAGSAAGLPCAAGWKLCLAVPAGIVCYAAVLMALRNADALDILRRLRLWWTQRHTSSLS